MSSTRRCRKNPAVAYYCILRRNFLENTLVQSCNDTIINAITLSLKHARVKNDENKVHKIFPTQTLKLLQRRKERQKTKNKSLSMKNELRALFKLVNKYIKKDYVNYRQDTIKKYLQHTGSTKKAYKILK